MKLSIVATLYYSSAYVADFCARASAAARQITDDYEIILVNDGSPDDSLALACATADADSHITVVDLSRNFGHHKAMMTGLAQTSGEMVFLIDSDLEEEPEWLPAFFAMQQQKGCDVVYGVQAVRRGSWFRRVGGQWFYTLFNLLSGLSVPTHAVTARLMTRRYVDALLRYNEQETFIPALWQLTGFDQQPHTVRKHDSSATTYTLTKKLTLCMIAVTSFSRTPLTAILCLGLTIMLLALAYTLYACLTGYTGWRIIIASIWLVGGLLITCIGIIAVYLGKILSEVRRQPYTIIRRIYRSGS